MTRSWRFVLVAAIVLGAWGLARPARADITQTQSIAPTDTDWNSSTTGTEPLVFQQFDPSAHPTLTLKEVDVTVTMGTKNTYSMTFISPSTISVSAIDPNTSNGVFAPTVSADTANWPLTSFIPSLHVQDPNGLLTKTETVSGGGTFPHTFDSTALGGPVNFSSTFPTAFLPSSADFSKFVGSGTISFPFLAQGTSTFLSSSGNGSGSVTTQAGVTMTVNYITAQKQIVPEPASALLLGLGAGGAFLARRWRSSRKAA
ncbi:MAG: choice-of-anchor E domain-containing protein [Isosphaeraceae bacterium]|nr:choice-of-anchor E domain-containing protein [Isosphaeraceae bacterium]